MKETIKKSIIGGITFFLTVLILFVTYATFTFDQPDSVGTGSGLTATNWNKMVNSIGYLKTTQDNQTTQITTLQNNPKFAATLGATNWSFVATPGVYTAIPFSQEVYDTTNSYNPTTYTYTIPKNGYYEFCINSSIYSYGTQVHNYIYSQAYGYLGIYYSVGGNWTPAHGCIQDILRQMILLYEKSILPAHDKGLQVFGQHFIED